MGTVRKRVNGALKERNITCIRVNSKWNRQCRLLFRKADDVDKVRRDETWLRTHFDRGTLYSEQWFPMRVDRAYREVATDELRCALFGQMNGVKSVAIS